MWLGRLHMIVPALAIAAVAVLALAAWRDVVTREIPDIACLAIAALGLAGRVTLGWGAVTASLATATALFALLVALHGRGVLGGGDVKLAAAVAVGLAPLATWDFVVTTALAGGLLGLPYLALPRLLTAAPMLPARPPGGAMRRVAAVEAWRMRRGGPLPYGVAIAAGASLTILQTSGT